MMSRFDDKRFKVIYSEGNGLTNVSVTILEDTETGVQYLFTASGYAGGLTALLDEKGNPVISRS